MIVTWAIPDLASEQIVGVGLKPKGSKVPIWYNVWFL